jgi:hypothetical protein
MNTYLVYLRFQLLRGTLSVTQYATEISFARDKLAATDGPHWREFIAAWDTNCS